MNGRVRPNVSEDLRETDGPVRIAAGPRRWRFSVHPAHQSRIVGPHISRRMPRFDRASSQSPPELTTLILLVPLSICEIACEADDGFLYTDDDRIYGSRWNNLCGADEVQLLEIISR